MTESAPRIQVAKRREGTTGYVVLDSPPVNAIGRDMRQGLLEAVLWAEWEGLERVIVSGRGRVFAAGGDTREFDAPPEPPHLPDVLNRIEASPVPWTAAAHGAALGGGLELMLACRYRIAAPGTQLGLPEVTLGVVPGAGGTQRLPRLIGVKSALELISMGRSITAEEARALGLIDEVDADPVFFAETTNGEWLGTAVPVGDLNTGEPAPEALAAARMLAARKLPGQDAPLRAIDLIEDACKLPLDAGMAKERAAFVELRSTPQAKALRHVFFAERAARTPPWLATTPIPMLSHVAVVGGGTMGAGIAYALLSVGLAVTVLETGADGVARARANIDRHFEVGLARGALAADQAANRRAGLVVTDDFGAISDVGLAIEAAFESMEVKQSILSALQSSMRPQAVLATNTSYLDIDAMAAGLDDPSRLLGLHFFAPAYIMKLLEIVRGQATSDAALALCFDLAKRLQKIPVLAGVCDGFIGNRILARLREAADGLLMDGTTPWEVDEAMVDFGYAMGPYETQDLSGLDIAFANRRRLDATRDPARRYVPIGDRMVEEGRLGRKTGVGWYRYPGGGGKVIDPLIEDLIREEARYAGVTRRDYTPDQIRHRLLMAMINEAADILAEGIAGSASDIDLVTVHGYGFPRWRGGLMHYADTIGPTAILGALRDLSHEDPLFWRPSPAIESCAAKGIPLTDWHR